MTASLFAAPAWAIDVMCHFDTECFEAEACDTADFDLEISPLPGVFEVRLGSVADDVRGQLTVMPNGATAVIARGPSSLQLLTIGLDRSARYTLQLAEGPAVISYHGSCRDQ